MYAVYLFHYEVYVPKSSVFNRSFKRARTQEIMQNYRVNVIFIGSGVNKIELRQNIMNCRSILT